MLRDSGVAVLGLGSGGSFVARELAKAGIGRFLLLDDDRLEVSNVARHECGLSDVGRLKVNAMRDYILDHNPAAEISTHAVHIDGSSRDQTRELLSSFAPGSSILVAPGGMTAASANPASPSSLDSEPPSYIHRWCRGPTRIHFAHPASPGQAHVAGGDEPVGVLGGQVLPRQPGDVGRRDADDATRPQDPAHLGQERVRLAAQHAQPGQRRHRQRPAGRPHAERVVEVHPAGRG